MHLRLHHCTKLQQFSQIAYLVPCSNDIQDHVRIRLAVPEDARFQNPMPNNPDARPKLDPATGHVKQPKFDRPINIESRRVTSEELKQVLMNRVDRSSGASSVHDLDDICEPFRNQPLPATNAHVGRARSRPRKPKVVARPEQNKPRSPPKPRGRSPAKPVSNPQQAGREMPEADRTAQGRYQSSSAPMSANTTQPVALSQPNQQSNFAMRPGDPCAGLNAQQFSVQPGASSMRPASPWTGPAAQHGHRAQPSSMAYQVPSDARAVPQQSSSQLPPAEAFAGASNAGPAPQQYQPIPPGNPWHTGPLQAGQTAQQFSNQQAPAWLAHSSQHHAALGPQHAPPPSNPVFHGHIQPGPAAQQFSSQQFPGPVNRGMHSSVPGPNQSQGLQASNAWQPGPSQPVQAGRPVSSQQPPPFTHHQISHSMPAPQQYHQPQMSDAWQPGPSQSAQAVQQSRSQGPPLYANQDVSFSTPAQIQVANPHLSSAWHPQAGPNPQQTSDQATPAHANHSLYQGTSAAQPFPGMQPSNTWPTGPSQRGTDLQDFPSQPSSAFAHPERELPAQSHQRSHEEPSSELWNPNDFEMRELAQLTRMDSPAFFANSDPSHPEAAPQQSHGPPASNTWSPGQGAAVQPYGFPAQPSGVPVWSQPTPGDHGGFASLPPGHGEPTAQLDAPGPSRMSSPEFPEEFYRIFDKDYEDVLPAGPATNVQSTMGRQAFQSSPMHAAAGSKPAGMGRYPSPPNDFAADFFDIIDAGNNTLNATNPAAHPGAAHPNQSFTGLTASEIHFVPPSEASASADPRPSSPDILEAFFGSHQIDDME